MEKYYIPDISEFHVGFECEVRWRLQYPDWDNFLIRDIEDFNEIFDIHFNLNEQVRVKYLGKEDIESLGWENRKKSVCDWYEWNKKIKDGFASYGYWNKLRLIHCENSRVKIVAFEYENSEEVILFQGEIKNKSELKKLMKQLKII